MSIISQRFYFNLLTNAQLSLSDWLLFRSTPCVCSRGALQPARKLLYNNILMGVTFTCIKQIVFLLWSHVCMCGGRKMSAHATLQHTHRSPFSFIQSLNFKLVRNIEKKTKSVENETMCCN